MGTDRHGGRRQGPAGRETASPAHANTGAPEAIRRVVGDRTPAFGCGRARRGNAHQGRTPTAAEPAVLTVPGPDRTGRTGVACAGSAPSGNSHGISTDSVGQPGCLAGHVSAYSSAAATGAELFLPRQGDQGDGTSTAVSTATARPHLAEACSGSCAGYYCVNSIRARTSTIAYCAMAERPGRAVLAAFAAG